LVFLNYDICYIVWIRQLLAFFGPIFSLEKFLELMYSDEGDDNIGDEDCVSEGFDVQINAGDKEDGHQQVNCGVANEPRKGYRSCKRNAAQEKDIANQAVKDLQKSSFELVFLSCVLEMFKALPIGSLKRFPSSSAPSDSCSRDAKDASHVLTQDAEEEGQVSVGQLSAACLSQLVARSGSLEAVLPGCGKVASQCLQQVDPGTFASINSVWRTLECAKPFLSQLDATASPDIMLPYLLQQAEQVVSLLEANCPVDGIVRTSHAVSRALPVLLQAAYQSAYDSQCGYHNASESASEALIDRAVALVLRVLCCGSNQAKIQLLLALDLWISRSFDATAFISALVRTNSSNATDFSTAAASVAGIGSCVSNELQHLVSIPLVRLVHLFEIHPATGRNLPSLLATPTMMQALLHGCYFSACSEDGQVSGVDIEIRELSVGLLEHVSSYLMHRKVSVQMWAGVLLPLKALEWAQEVGNDTVSSSSSWFSASNRDRLAATISFGRRIQVRFCIALM
jgi:hypothetical protein